jgi:orotidine-5'-phosphate decarboxylase
VFGVYKIGLELFCAEGPQVVDAVRDAGAQAIFLDLKLHDIPRTVASAVSRVTGLGVNYLTIHAGGGGEMMAAAVETADGKMDLLAVTVLTSLDQKGLVSVGVDMPLRESVSRRGLLAQSSGVPGLVCSAQEVSALRAEFGPTLKLVTPGIRFPDQAAGDQKRVVDPASALASGASMLVIGRAVTAASEPEVILSRLDAVVS